MELVLEKPKKIINSIKGIEVCAISDLHGYLPKLKPCDLVLICGDSVSLIAQNNSNKTRNWYLQEFKPWTENLNCNKVLFIAGNHELYINKNDLWIQEQFNREQKATYLENELYEYGDLRIFGTPYCKQFGDWAFMYNNSALRVLFSKIPYDLDILMSHDAPYGCCDIVLEDCDWATNKNLGNIPLYDEIIKKKPKISVFGHIHSGLHNGTIIEDTKFYNVSISTEKYLPLHEPTYIKL